jgi:hypothetical protein
MITKEWVQPIDAPHKQFKASSDVNDAAGNVMVTAYAVERPDGQWSVMHFTGQVDRITFGSSEYQWHRDATGGHADPDGPPSKSTLKGGAETLYQIPKASITILRGRVGE